MEQQNDSSVNSIKESAVSAVVLPGATLREAREKLGLSVADAADQTKLAPRQIEALEADDYAHLPEMAFVRGFVRSYAKILHLDPQPLLALLPQAIASGAAQVTRSSVEVPFPDAHSPRVQNLIWLGAALLLAVLVVVFAVWHYTSPASIPEPEKAHPVEMAVMLPAEAHVVPASDLPSSDVPETTIEPPVEQNVPTLPAKPGTAAPLPPVTNIKPIQPVTPPVAVPATKPSAAVAAPVAKPVAPVAVSAVKATQAVAVTPGKPVAPVTVPTLKPLAPVAASAVKAATVSTVVRLAFGEETWAEVRDAKGNVISSQINPAGSELNLKGQGPFSLVVGHASTSRLFHKGKQIDLVSHASANSDVARLTLE